MTGIDNQAYVYRAISAGGAVVDVFDPNVGGFGDGKFRVVCEMCNDIAPYPGNAGTLAGAQDVADRHAVACRKVPAYRLGAAPAAIAPKPLTSNCTCACHGTEIAA